MKPNGVILYEGPSVLTGAPIVAIVTGLSRRSENPKTGDMLQTYILPATAPHIAVRTGADVAVCGSCPLRPAVNGGCYVRTSDAPLAVWQAYGRGAYAPLNPDTLAAATGRLLRLGSYGDPVAVPFDAWEPLLTVVRGHTGYTHQWANPAGAWASAYCMASAETAAGAERAESMGWRVFHVGPAPTLTRRVITCPASSEAGKRTTCAKCRLCNGTSGLSRVHITIAPHGAQKARI